RSRASDLRYGRDARTGSLGRHARPAQDHSHRQRQGVLRQGHGRLGARARRAVAPDRTGQAEPERLHRIVQRPPARRMSQRTLVSQPAVRPHRDRTLAAGIQRGATEEGVGRADTGRLREAVKVTPDSKPTRYSKRGDVVRKPGPGYRALTYRSRRTATPPL